ncbi:uncharacterized protein LOC118483972 [Helianthus annuus]|uniref:uncharacterized protein LOC118483972 n=1 Tax=Helianthus annuus TaxID=4232 RepID=UPI001652CA5B|nr:uncharacterized protein LOC118483972 [Helianthus annuus]
MAFGLAIAFVVIGICILCLLVAIVAANASSKQEDKHGDEETAEDQTQSNQDMGKQKRNKVVNFMVLGECSFSTGTVLSPRPPPAPPRLLGHHRQHLFSSCITSCIMPIDKSWIDSPLQSPHYQEGLKSFIAMCERVLPSHNEVRCPCSKCKCSGLTTITKMKLHLGRMVFWKDYIKWDYHGEKSRPAVVEVDNVVPQEGMENVIEDIRGERMEEDTDRNLEMSGGESNGVDDDFEDIIKDVESELYPGCTEFSSLDFLAKLMNLKETSHWTNTSFDGLLKLFQESMPIGNKIPPTHYVVKKKVKKIGLDYEMIDACVNDCALFWKEHESLKNCPVCL